MRVAHPRRDPNKYGPICTFMLSQLEFLPPSSACPASSAVPVAYGIFRSAASLRGYLATTFAIDAGLILYRKSGCRGIFSFAGSKMVIACLASPVPLAQ